MGQTYCTNGTKSSRLNWAVEYSNSHPMFAKRPKFKCLINETKNCLIESPSFQMRRATPFLVWRPNAGTREKKPLISRRWRRSRLMKHKERPPLSLSPSHYFQTRLFASRYSSASMIIAWIFLQWTSARGSHGDSKLHRKFYYDMHKSNRHWL